MSDRCCPTCQRTFHFPSDLKKHFKSSFHCLKNDIEINEYFSENKVVKKEKKKKNHPTDCEDCGKDFATYGSLVRHKNVCKGANTINIENNSKIEVQNIINNLNNEKKIYKVVLYMQ